MIVNDLSIYISVYNGEKTIEKVLFSIFKQSIQPQKILIINDGSTDSTNKILEKYKNKLTVITNTNNGLAYSRNLALKLLNTKYVACIDADVEIEENWLKLMYDKIKENKYHWIGGKLIEKYIENKFNFWRAVRIGQHHGDNNIENPKFIFGCNNILNTDVLKKNCYYRTDDKYFRTNGEDTEFSNLLKLKGFKLYYLADAKCYHLADDNAKSISNRYWRYMFWGDGMKKRNLFKTLKNILRQFKKTIKWTIEDFLKKRYVLIICNFIIFLYFIYFEVLNLKKNLK